MKIHFACPSCDAPTQVDTYTPPRQERGSLDTVLPGAVWRCPQCDHLLALSDVKDEPVPGHCHVCGNKDLYKKKDFPHGLGLAILTLACVASTITYGLYDKWLTWAILIGSAAFDGLLYLWVKDVVVCYRCQAHHRGIPAGSPVPPFELTIGERYRQEQIRREQLAAERGVQGVAAGPSTPPGASRPS